MIVDGVLQWRRSINQPLARQLSSDSRFDRSCGPRSGCRRNRKLSGFRPLLCGPDGIDMERVDDIVLNEDNLVKVS